MAISKTNAAAGNEKWMEIAPPGKEYIGRRRSTVEKKFRSLNNAELMDGFRPAFPAVSDFLAKRHNGRFASAEC